MRVLVVGGAGYIGSVVSARLLASGHEVIVLDDLSTGHRDAVPEGAEFHGGSTAEAEPLGEVLAEGVGAVFHFAARSLVGESTLLPELYWGNNVGGTLSLLAAMRTAGVARLVFSSSAAVYGEPETIPISEEAPARPTSPYGNSKLAADLLIGDECRAHGLSAVSLRYFNVAGSALGLGERHRPETHLIPLVLEVAAGHAEAASVFGVDYPTPDGTAVRDYIHVEDLAEAHLLALAATGAAAGRRLIYNLGNGRGFSVLDVIRAAREATGADIPLRHQPRRPGDPAVLVASSRRIASELGWVPRRPGLRGMVADAWEFARRSAPG